MGLVSYFKAPTQKKDDSKSGKKSSDKNQPALNSIDEKTPAPLFDRRVSSSQFGPYGYGSSRTSLAGIAKSNGFVDDIRHEVMANYLFQQQCGSTWIGDGAGITEGVMVRKGPSDYLACPPGLLHSAFAQGCMALNLPCAMTINSRVVKTFLSWSPNAVDVPLKNGMRVQILPTIEDLPKARKLQFAAFVAADGLLIVWDDDPENLFKRAHAIESELMDIVWRATGPDVPPDDSDDLAEIDEKHSKVPRVVATEIDEESGEYITPPRKLMILNSLYLSFALCVVVVMLGAGFRQIAIEVAVDGQYLRCILVLMVPVQIFFTLFFAQVLVGGFVQLFGPIKQIKENSKYYSAVLPVRLTRRPLPHVTIQCPVYKEGLNAVIVPTVKSIKTAISTYEMQGGTANIFINDDGLQIIPEEERQARIDFYADNSIGWTARPKHGSDGFIRRGKFKKASNMNFGLMVSNNVETKLAQVQRHDHWTQTDEAVEYDRCLREALEEHGRAWADGNIRIGDYILIIDSDTQVPVDCLLDAVSEMEQSPEVGVMQFASGVMQVVHTYFENGITFFTNVIYSAIKLGVSNGDVAPFVGHNAIIRWSAVQELGYFDEDGYEKFWSEAHVSEDFEMSLKMQCNGYIIRLASWDQGGFKEGVSLTVYDELARWEKYAYGCNELLFNPLRTWLWRGPFTSLFRQFLFCNIPFVSKVATISYIGTYYAIGAAWILTLLNYFLIGWFNGYLDKYYIDSWNVWFTVVLVFTGLGNLALAAVRYRTGERTFFGSLFENLKWTLMFAIFLGGISIHVSQALLSHMFEINMTWGATSKEADDSNFFLEVPKVLKSFKFSMTFSLLMLIMVIVLATSSFVPYDWRITDFIAILPMSSVWLSHVLLPIALNPALMTFKF